MWTQESRERLRAVILECDFGDWSFHIGGDDETAVYLQVGFDADCAWGGPNDFRKGRKWLLSPHMTSSEIVQTAFKACLTALEHEAREDFRYRGRAVFGPHFNVERLAALCDLGDPALDVRAATP